MVTIGPNNEQVQKVYNGYNAEVVKNRGVSVDQLLNMMRAWLYLIEHGEDRMYGIRRIDQKS